MKLISRSCFLIVLFISCNKDQTNNNSTGVIDYKQKMREFVIGISQYSKAINPNFNIIPQNGIELVSSSGDNPASPHTAYLSAIDANGQEDLIYGYNTDDQLTPFDTTAYLKNFLNLSKNANKKILVIDYCFTHSKMDSSYLLNNNSGYISFAADKRQLNDIPNYPAPIYQENNSTITSILQAKNFLYLINLSNYSTKADFIKAVTATNYDLLITDLFFNDGTAFTAAEINQLKNKANGGKRLVVSYMSIGEAENYRYYWQSNWKTNNPVWLDAENPNWQGNFEVKYWYPEWQNIIYGNDNSYLKKIINAGFDGAYLDIIDAFKFYESK
ncbi:MAG: endo alpha-1,4 polygalactosaminidase [Bacteroidota bacterium]|nr:endo alpha-1,4 polygalactosaminidase [Bacteroidota bacterium]